MSKYQFHVALENVDHLTVGDAKEINNALTDAVFAALGEQDIDTDGVSVNVSAPEIDGHSTGTLTVEASWDMPPSESDDDE